MNLALHTSKSILLSPLCTNKCYLFTSCEQGCLLLHPKNIQVLCVVVDDLYNNKWKTTCMHKYIGLYTNNLHNNNMKIVKINEILSEECVFSVLGCLVT